MRTGEDGMETDTMDGTRKRTFTRQDGNDQTATDPGGYVITHVFQYQEDETRNVGQYTETEEVDGWEEIPTVVESMLNVPDSAGYTVSITIAAKNS